MRFNIFLFIPIFFSYNVFFFRFRFFSASSFIWTFYAGRYNNAMSGCGVKYRKEKIRKYTICYWDASEILICNRNQKKKKPCNDKMMIIKTGEKNIKTNASFFFLSYFSHFIVIFVPLLWVFPFFLASSFYLFALALMMMMIIKYNKFFFFLILFVDEEKEIQRRNGRECVSFNFLYSALCCYVSNFIFVIIDTRIEEEKNPS